MNHILHERSPRGPRRRAAAPLLVLLLAGAAVAQYQVMGGHVLDASTRSGSLGLNAPTYRPGTLANSQSIGRAYSAGYANGIATPTYRAPLSYSTPTQSYRYQTPGGSGVISASRTGMGTYVDPLASTMYNPLRNPTVVQRNNPATGQRSSIQLQPYGSMGMGMYRPY
ncbi:MAG: hypothetical protein IT436_11530 [Phycisphaerales bacterium]|nr:hypothetical protein [Phycisphaerales bacterium]